LLTHTTTAINCGSSTNNTALDKQIWVGDNIDNSNLFTFIEPKTTSQSLKTQPNSLSNTQIPFTTARASLSNFTYSFSNIITNSPIFLRLHFYPTFYQNFEPTNALFSVEVNHNLTLLKNFNSSQVVVMSMGLIPPIQPELKNNLYLCFLLPCLLRL